VGIGSSASLPAPCARERGVWKTSVWGLLLTGALCTISPLQLLSGSVAPICLVAADHVGSDSFAGKQLNAASARHSDSATNDANGAPLFSMDSEPMAGGALLEQWRRVQAAITEELEIIAQCRAGKSCPLTAQRLIDLGREGAGRNERARVGIINRAVDLAVSPVSDETQWGIADHWSDPFETLHSNSGDCEDYAIVKYAALLVAGFAKDAVKVVLLRNRFPSEDHAVVAVQVDRHWLILDNRTLTLVRDTDMRRVIPQFVLDDQGVRRFH
jgi:predicted transglutaminase-like cysteine proteinase